MPSHDRLLRRASPVALAGCRFVRRAVRSSRRSLGLLSRSRPNRASCLFLAFRELPWRAILRPGIVRTNLLGGPSRLVELDATPPRSPGTRSRLCRDRGFVWMLPARFGPTALHASALLWPRVGTMGCRKPCRRCWRLLLVPPAAPVARTFGRCLYKTLNRSRSSKLAALLVLLTPLWRRNRYRNLRPRLGWMNPLHFQHQPNVAPLRPLHFSPRAGRSQSQSARLIGGVEASTPKQYPRGLSFSASIGSVSQEHEDFERNLVWIHHSREMQLQDWRRTLHSIRWHGQRHLRMVVRQLSRSRLFLCTARFRRLAASADESPQQEANEERMNQPQHMRSPSLDYSLDWMHARLTGSPAQKCATATSRRPIVRCSPAACRRAKGTGNRLTCICDVVSDPA